MWGNSYFCSSNIAPETLDEYIKKLEKSRDLLKEIIELQGRLNVAENSAEWYYKNLAQIRREIQQWRENKDINCGS